LSWRVHSASCARRSACWPPSSSTTSLASRQVKPTYHGPIRFCRRNFHPSRRRSRRWNQRRSSASVDALRSSRSRCLSCARRMGGSCLDPPLIRRCGRSAHPSLPRHEQERPSSALRAPSPRWHGEKEQHGLRGASLPFSSLARGEGTAWASWCPPSFLLIGTGRRNSMGFVVPAFLSPRWHGEKEQHGLRGARLPFSSLARGEGTAWASWCQPSFLAAESGIGTKEAGQRRPFLLPVPTGRRWRGRAG